MDRGQVFIADDFGMSAGINAAVIECHDAGAIDGASLMMGQEATAGAVACAKDRPDLPVGLHLHYDDSRPLMTPRWPWGRHWLAACVAGRLSAWHAALLRAETRAQFAAFGRTGLELAFVNSHHHVHALAPVVFATLLECLPAGFAGWIRLGRPRLFTAPPLQCLPEGLPHVASWGGRRNDTLWGVDGRLRMNAAEIQRVCDSLPDGFHEFIFHPGACERRLRDKVALLDLAQGPVSG